MKKSVSYPYVVPDEPGRWSALALAAAMHAALFAFLWIGIRKEERAQYQLLILRPALLVGDEDCSFAQFLKEQALLEKNIIQCLRGRHFLEVDIDLSRLCE